MNMRARPRRVTGTFGARWHGLGPFQIGTREAVWGVDPLERHGGFHALPDPPIARAGAGDGDGQPAFHSSLAPGGLVRWSAVEVVTSDAEDDASTLDAASTTTTLRVTYPDIDWALLRAVYGWAAAQFQCWVRGSIDVEGDDDDSEEASYAFELYTDGAIELWVDGEHYFGGDLFGFRRAPAVLNLTRGTHRLELRFARDTRAMGGGVGPPAISAALGLVELAPPEPGALPIKVVPDSVVLPDFVDGRLASYYASFALRNHGHQDIEVNELIWSTWQRHMGPGSRQRESEATITAISLRAGTEGLVIRAGQTRPVAMVLEGHCSMVHKGSEMVDIIVQISSADTSLTLEFQSSLHNAEPGALHKFTYLHPSGTVSFAMLRPPPPAADDKHFERLPVLLALHGAGVRGDDPELCHSLDGVADLPCWTLVPSGVTSWCGDDWHQWGSGDVRAALEAVERWIKETGWLDTGFNPSKILLIGHSNGGQGAWYTLLHHPDRIIAAAPLSGYASIQKYVPYTFWREADPRRNAVVEASLNSYRHELLLENASCIPILAQHGSADDNVPAFHSRRMLQLADEVGLTIKYAEVEGAGHWFDGIMTTTCLKEFYRAALLNAKTSHGPPFVERNTLHVAPKKFKIIAANTGDTSSKFGYRIEQLIDPGQIGHLIVMVTDKGLELETSNVERLTIPSWRTTACSFLIINQEVVAFLNSQSPWCSFELDVQNMTWRNCHPDQLYVITERRTGDQLGNMDAILRTKGPLSQFFAMERNVEIYDSTTRSPPAVGNMISLGIGADIGPGALPLHPIQLHGSHVTVRDDAKRQRRYSSERNGLCAIFLRPLERERLELVVWGSDEKSLAAAARLVPIITGGGQPDFVVFTLESLWKGVEGALAMGFFDSKWNVTRSSFLQ